jgi:hypothetical protein
MHGHFLLADWCVNKRSGGLSFSISFTAPSVGLHAIRCHCIYRLPGYRLYNGCAVFAEPGGNTETSDIIGSMGNLDRAKGNPPLGGTSGRTEPNRVFGPII